MSLQYEPPPTYPERIKQLRVKLGLTQARLAQLIGVSLATVSRWETGQAKPSTPFWRVLEEAEEHGLYALRQPAAELLTVAERASALQGGDPSPSLDFSADPEAVRAVAEAERLTYGYLYNPAFAAEVSLIEPLPHQRIAVYQRLLTLPRIRFLLADDPGAGKTIMSGLLIRELLSRRLVRRVLIVAPAGLLTNWKRELRKLFHLPFEIISGADARSRNPFSGEDSDLLIVSVDTLAGDRMFARLQEPDVEPYDIAFFDEAHKLSVNRNADFTIEKTDRYKLAEALAGVRSDEPRWTLSWNSHHLMLLTATPHMGKPYPYFALWRLLDQDVFGSMDAFNAVPADARKRYFIRRTKEEMVRYDGSRIYPKRVSDTIGCDMSQDEKRLYDLTTDYIRNHYNRARFLNRSAARLAMSVFQRRLTSSTWALMKSFERRIKKLDLLIDSIRSGMFAEFELEARQRELGTEIPDPIDSKAPDEEEGEETEALEEKALGGVVAVNLKELLAEREQVVGLLQVATTVYDKGQESKFEKLREVLQDPRFKDEKLLLFTEHKDTLDFILHRLEGIGFAGKVAFIHGGMASGEEASIERLTERQDHVEFFRQPTAKGGATYMVCTDAAAEGINLQFCWLMVNYDIPWNPARLEQRMGRIHRYGQEHDPVHIINLVADPKNTREGRVLQTLLDKLENIRKELGSDKVFDVIGRLFEGRTLAQYMEDVVLRGTEPTTHDLDARVTKERVEAVREEDRAVYGEAAEVARELPKLKKELASENLRRLMPGYVRRFVEKSAPLVSIGFDGDLDDVFSLKSQKPRALDPLLAVIESYPSERRNRFAITKPKPEAATTTVFFHPGEPVFDRLRAWISMRFERDALTGAAFIDPYATTPYVFHLARVSIIRRAEATLPSLQREELIESRLVGVRLEDEGKIEACPVEHLLLLRGGQGVPTAARRFAATVAGRIASTHAYIEERLARPLVDEQRARLLARLAAQEEAIRRGFDYQEADLAAARVKLRERAEAGKLEAKNELANVKNRQAQLYFRRDTALAVLEREVDLVDVGEIEFIAHALVVPSSDPADKRRHDAEVEATAMRVVRAYEEEAGAIVIDVHTPDLARAAGLPDYPGFDLLSRRPGGEERSIEVKGRARVGEVELSENEWGKAATLRSGYWLYAVFDCATDQLQMHPVRDPFQKLLSFARMSAVIPAAAVVQHAEGAGIISLPPSPPAGQGELGPLFSLLDQWKNEPGNYDEEVETELDRTLKDSPIRFREPNLKDWDDS